MGFAWHHSQTFAEKARALKTQMKTDHHPCCGRFVVMQTKGVDKNKDG
jgi:hypothetical protein